jgi:formate dehydrogenase major subunit
MIAHTINGEIVNIEGNPIRRSTRATCAPKARPATSWLSTIDAGNGQYRAPGLTTGRTRPLDWAMGRIAQLVKQTRDETFQERTSDGKTLMNTTSIFSLGGATIDNEWNYTHSKLMRALGIVAIENQARI